MSDKEDIFPTDTIRVQDYTHVGLENSTKIRKMAIRLILTVFCRGDDDDICHLRYGKTSLFFGFPACYAMDRFEGGKQK